MCIEKNENKNEHSLTPCANCSARCVSAFQRLNSDQSALVDSLREIKNFSAGQKIDPSEDGVPHFFCIFQGHIKIELGEVGHEKSIRICGPGELVGLQTDHSYSLYSIDEVTVCKIETQAFKRLQMQVPAISLGLIDKLLKSQSQEDFHLKGLENHSIKNRIASTLVLLAEKFGVRDSKGTTIDMNIDRKTLAQLSGTVVESLSRVLTELEADQLIKRQGRKIKITQHQKLIDLSNE